jgi:hypothetical protein
MARRLVAGGHHPCEQGLAGFFSPASSGNAALSRSILTILIVAAISGWISYGERWAGDAALGADWIRTADGWESRQVLQPFEYSAPPAVHPAVIAALQLLASAFFLAAFPARVGTAARSVTQSLSRTHLRPTAQVAAAG